jgi:hypothetical protein
VNTLNHGVRIVRLLTTSVCIVVAAACGTEKEGAFSTEEAAHPSLPYFGQPVPGLTPELFAPGIVNTDGIEFNGVFSPDGREFFFGRHVAGVDTMFHSVYAEGRWSDPVRLPAFPGDVSGDMAVSPDGLELYFLGQHPNEYAPENPTWDIWVSHRVDREWTLARVVPPPISTEAMEVYPVVVGDGSLYFSSDRPGGLGPTDLYRAQRLPDGSFAEPVNVGPPVNSEFGTGDTFVAQDESYMIFSSRRPPSLGRGDLFVSFRLDDGRWGEPIHLGDVINTEEHEFCPMVTPDGRYLFFTRLYGGSWENATGGAVFWIDARFIDQFRP